VQLYSLRRILGFSLSLLALVPALLAAWLLTRASTSSVEEMAQGLLTQVAERIQLATEDHMRQAHVILNGLVSVRMTPAEEAQAREWLRHPAHFEAMAFALVHQTQDVPSVYLGTLLGAYLGMEATPEGVKVARREADGVGRQFFLSGRPGERGRPLAFETDNFEPRTRVWYAGAADAKGRVFSPVRVSMESRQLFVSLSQPVYDIDGGVAGVFGVDLHLKQLADRLRTQRISAHGAAFVVDERGALVASSAGDALFVDVGGGGPNGAAPPRAATPSSEPVFRRCRRCRRCRRSVAATWWPAARQCCARPPRAKPCSWSSVRSARAWDCAGPWWWRLPKVISPRA